MSQSDVERGTRLDDALDVLKAPGRSAFARIQAVAVLVTGLFLAFFILYTAAFGTIASYLQRMVYLSGILVLGLLLKPVDGRPWDRRTAWSTIVDFLLVAVVLVASIYVLLDYDNFALRIGFPTSTDVMLGVLYVLVTLEVTRRYLGWPMLFIVAFFVLQALFGNYFPGSLRAPSVRWTTLVEILFMQDQGVFGEVTGVAATYLMLFMIFSALLAKTGAIQFFNDLSLALLGRRPGGPAHVAVMSSALLGTASGSVVGNVVGTGTFTIALMKRAGYHPTFAAAVEAVASSGGQLMPPIMGSAAFLMAAFLNISYWEVVKASLIPALLYFLAIFLQVELRSRRQQLSGADVDGLSIVAVLKDGGYLLLAIAGLIVPFFFGASAQRAGFIGVLTLFVLSFIKPATRISARDFLAALYEAFTSNVTVGAAVGTASIIVGTVWVSGVGSLLADMVVQLSGGVLIVALVFTGIVGLILGMGLPTPAVYLTIGLLLVPSLVKMGAPTLASHLFGFYFGILANVTPPVALAAYAAASIARSDMNKTGWTAFRLAIAGFLVPFAFVYNPALLLNAPPLEVGWAFVTACVGVFMLAAATEGWLAVEVPASLRILCAIAAPLLIWRHWATEAAGLALVAVVIVYGLLTRRAALGRRAAAGERAGGSVSRKGA